MDPIAWGKWAQEIQTVYNNYLQCLSVMPSTAGTSAVAVKGQHSGQLVTAPTETVYFEFTVPEGINSFKEAGIRFIATTTGTFDYTITFQFGAVGSSSTANTLTASVTGEAATSGLIDELDLPISTYFKTLARGDQVSVKFVLDGLTTTTEVYLLNLYIKYI
jgi:hypothetical protein